MVLVLKAGLTDANRKKLTDTIKGWLKDVKVVSETEMGKKKLAYQIKHEADGYYIGYALQGETIPSDFERRLFAQNDVLRHLLLRSK